GQEPGRHRDDGHELRPDAPRRALDDRLLEVGGALQASRGRTLAVRELQVEQHHDAGLRVEARERDEADGDRDAPVVAEEPSSHTAPISENGTAASTIAVSTAEPVFA